MPAYEIEAQEDGFTTIRFPDGTTRRVTDVELAEIDTTHAVVDTQAFSGKVRDGSSQNSTGA